jgi:hypothetical protein
MSASRRRNVDRGADKDKITPEQPVEWYHAVPARPEEAGRATGFAVLTLEGFLSIHRRHIPHSTNRDVEHGKSINGKRRGETM